MDYIHVVGVCVWPHLDLGVHSGMSADGDSRGSGQMVFQRVSVFDRKDMGSNHNQSMKCSLFFLCDDLFGRVFVEDLLKFLYVMMI